MATAKMVSNAAEIHRGEAICREKLDKMLDEFSVPRCLFHKVDQIEEFGFNRSTGFYWLKRKSKSERKIDKLGTAYHDKDLSAFIQQRSLRKITGLKAKEMFVTLTVTDVYVGVPTSDKVKFVSSAGIYRVHPIAVFEPAAGEDHSN